MTNNEHGMEPMLERTALARLLTAAREEASRCRIENEGLIGEVKRLEGQVRQWSRANAALLARLERTELALRELREERKK